MRYCKHILFECLCVCFSFCLFFFFSSFSLYSLFVFVFGFLLSLNWLRILNCTALIIKYDNFLKSTSNFLQKVVFLGNSCTLCPATFYLQAMCLVLYIHMCLSVFFHHETKTLSLLTIQKYSTDATRDLVGALVAGSHPRRLRTHGSKDIRQTGLEKGNWV